MIYIIKRDGRKKKFDKFKIVDAVLAAFKSVDGTITEYAEIKAGNIADYIQYYAENSDHELTIEEIQDLVEKGLSSTKRKDVAKAFILYRENRSNFRNVKENLTKKYKQSTPRAFYTTGTTTGSWGVPPRSTPTWRARRRGTPARRAG